MVPLYARADGPGTQLAGQLSTAFRLCLRRHRVDGRLARGDAVWCTENGARQLFRERWGRRQLTDEFVRATLCAVAHKSHLGDVPQGDAERATEPSVCVGLSKQWKERADESGHVNFGRIRFHEATNGEHVLGESRVGVDNIERVAQHAREGVLERIAPVDPIAGCARHQTDRVQVTA